MTKTFNDVYHTEIFNFLKTVTIKFDPMIALVGNSLKNYIDVSLDTDSNNYYYDHLMGNYLPGDTKMYVKSVDTGDIILFSKENLKKHPRTASVYKVPNIEYTNLCKKYDTQVDLIKSIVYPISDISLLKNSSKIAYITGDTSLLQSTEVYSILDAINNFCTYMESRWYVKEFCYEEGYPVAFYSLLWQMLPLICFTRRMTNIKTNAAHEYHIWEYLKSHGLNDYRNVLTMKQSLFLYKNIEYILANKGTASNLVLLSDKILSDFAITLYGKHIYQQQIDRFSECRRTPEVISIPVVDASKISDIGTSSLYTTTFESLSAINSRMFNKRITRLNTVSYVTSLEAEYGNVEEDRIPTKLLELKKEPINSATRNMFLQFLTDTLIYRLSKQKLSYNVTFVDTVTNSTILLSIQDAYFLFYYAVQKANKYNPIKLPKFGRVNFPYKLQKPATTDIRKYIYISDIPYEIRSYVNIDGVIDSIPWNDDTIYSLADFTDLIYNQFNAMMTHVLDVEQSAELIYNRAMTTVYNVCCAAGNYEMPLGTITDYASFFAATPTLQAIHDTYKDLNNTEYYEKLASNVLTSMIDLTDSKFIKFLGATDSVSKLFDNMTSLLVQLSSYNVTFLGTDRESTDYIYMTPFELHAMHTCGKTTGFIDANQFVFLRSRTVGRTYETITPGISFEKQRDVTKSKLKLDSGDNHLVIIDKTKCFDKTNVDVRLPIKFND